MASFHHRGRSMERSSRIENEYTKLLKDHFDGKSISNLTQSQAHNKLRMMKRQISMGAQQTSHQSKINSDSNKATPDRIVFGKKRGNLRLSKSRSFQNIAVLGSPEKKKIVTKNASVNRISRTGNPVGRKKFTFQTLVGLNSGSLLMKSPNSMIKNTFDISNTGEESDLVGGSGEKPGDLTKFIKNF